MNYDAICKECKFEEKWEFITVSEYEKRKIDYKCPNCTKVGTMQNSFSTVPPVHYKGNGWTGAGLGAGHDWRSRLDKELTINDQLSERNDEGFRKANEKIKRAEEAKYKEMESAEKAFNNGDM